MKEKLGKEVRPYVILGACNPGFAYRMLEQDPLMGLPLPCTVIVYQRSDGAILVSLARPNQKPIDVGSYTQAVTTRRPPGKALARSARRNRTNR